MKDNRAQLEIQETMRMLNSWAQEEMKKFWEHPFKVHAKEGEDPAEAKVIEDFLNLPENIAMMRPKLEEELAKGVKRLQNLALYGTPCGLKCKPEHYTNGVHRWKESI